MLFGMKHELVSLSRTSSERFYKCLCSDFTRQWQIVLAIGLDLYSCRHLLNHSPPRLPKESVLIQERMQHSVWVSLRKDVSQAFVYSLCMRNCRPIFFLFPLGARWAGYGLWLWHSLNFPFNFLNACIQLTACKHICLAPPKDRHFVSIFLFHGF